MDPAGNWNGSPQRVHSILLMVLSRVAFGTRITLEALYWMMGLQLVSWPRLLSGDHANSLRGSTGETARRKMTSRFAAFSARVAAIAPGPSAVTTAKLWKECAFPAPAWSTKLAVIGVVSTTLCGSSYLTYTFAKPAVLEVLANGYRGLWERRGSL